MSKECDRCEDEYEKYIVFIRDTLPAITDHLNSEFDDLCKPCRVHLHPKQAFSGAGDVTPKKTVNS